MKRKCRSVCAILVMFILLCMLATACGNKEEGTKDKENNKPAAGSEQGSVTGQPTVTDEPTAEPTAELTAEPTAEPTTEPAAEPTTDPVAPTTEPAAQEKTFKLVFVGDETSGTTSTYEVVWTPDKVSVNYVTEVEHPDRVEGPAEKPEGSFEITDPFFTKPLEKLLPVIETDDDLEVQDNGFLMLRLLEQSQDRAADMNVVNGSYFYDMFKDRMDADGNGKITVEEAFVSYARLINPSVEISTK